MTEGPTAFRWRWVAAGAAGAGAVALALATRRAAGTGMIDYPWLDGALRLGAEARLLLLATGAAALAGAVAAAARRHALLEAACGAIAAFWLGGVVVAWTWLEERETAADSHELRETQEGAAAQIGAAIRARVTAAGLLAAVDEQAFVPAAARAGASLAGTPATGLVDARGRVIVAVPEAERHRLEEAIARIPAEGGGEPAWVVPIGFGPDGTAREGSVVLVAARSAAGRMAAMLVEPGAPLDIAATPGGSSVRVDVTVAALPGGRAAEPPAEPTDPGLALLPAPTAVVAGGLEWRVAARPSRDWLDARHHRGNTALLALGALGAASILAGARFARHRSATVARISALESQAARLAVRLRIASLARDSIAQEASHVIRARLRETSRALDAATDPVAGPDVRNDALRRLGASLAQAEAEVGALLESPAGTRIARAERDAELEHHYARTVLDFAGGPSVDLSKPLPEGAVAAIQRQLGTRTFAVVTSDNPMSTPLPAQANMLRRGILAHELRAARLAHLPVTGRNAEGTWSEQGFAVAAGPAEAEALAEAHEQRAYFWFDGSAFVLQEAVGARRAIALPPAAADRAEA